MNEPCTGWASTQASSTLPSQFTPWAYTGEWQLVHKVGRDLAYLVGLDLARVEVQDVSAHSVEELAGVADNKQRLRPPGVGKKPDALCLGLTSCQCYLGKAQSFTNKN